MGHPNPHSGSETQQTTDVLDILHSHIEVRGSGNGRTTFSATESYSGSDIAGIPARGARVELLHDAGGVRQNAFVVHTNAEGDPATFFVPGMKLAGCYSRIGSRPTDRVIITVDYASALALHKFCETSVAVAYFYENLAAVCNAVRSQYPDIEMVLAVGGAHSGTERARALTCRAALETMSSVANAPGAGTFAEALEKQGPPAVLEALATATPWDQLDSQVPRVASTEIVPFSAPVHGAALIRQIMAHLSSHTLLPPAAVLAISLWTLASHVPERFTIAPILALLSVTRRCGKTSALAAIKPLLRRPLVASDVTAAALSESVNRGETPVLDEVDQYLERHSGLVTVLNAGHSREASKIVRKGSSCDVFGFKVLCAIGELPAATIDRAIVITFIRKGGDVPVTRYKPSPGDDACLLHSMIYRFWLDNAPKISERDAPDPDVENDRAKDNWRPLLATARLCGDDILEEALQAAKELTRTEDDNPHVLEEFIVDVVRIFVEGDRRVMSSKELQQELCADLERPWATYSRGKPLSFRDLAGLMRKAKVRVGEQFNDGTTNSRGYWRKDLQHLIDGYGARDR